jgi:hypothetical protein
MGRWKISAGFRKDRMGDWTGSAVCVCGSARAAAARRYCSRVSGFAKRNNKGGPNCRVGGPVWKIPNTPAPLGISPLRIWKRESVKSVRAHVNLHDLDILIATFKEHCHKPSIRRSTSCFNWKTGRHVSKFGPWRWPWRALELSETTDATRARQGRRMW